MNDKLKYIVTSILLSSLFAVLYTGCKSDSIEINALPFQENEGDNWGLISTSGKIEIPSGSFTRQPSAVVNGMFSLPDEKGYYQLYELKHPTHPTSARRFAQIGHFFEDVTLAQEFPDSPILIIDRKGQSINNIGISLHYDIVLAHNFAEGRALFCTRKGKYGYMDTRGNILIPPIYDQAYDFHEGLALTGNTNDKGETSYQLIDLSGNVRIQIQDTPALLDPQPACGLIKYNNCQSGQCCYLSTTGKEGIFLPDSIREAFRFRHNAAIIHTDHGAGLIDREGKLLIAPTYEEGFIVGNDRVCLRIGNEWQLTDFEGNSLGEAKKSYERISTFYPSELAIVRSGTQCRWMNRQGKPADNRTYHCIAEDPSALQLVPQVFVRRNTKTKNEENSSVNRSEKTETVSAPSSAMISSSPSTMTSSSEKNSQSNEPSAGNPHTTCIISCDEWKNIGKQNPFYAEARKILSGKLAETDAENRQVILNYVEHLRTSYTTKDIDFLTQLFSEEALIIVGKVIRSTPRTDGKYLPQHQVEYNIKSKHTYLERLKVLFKQNKEINLQFSDFKIMRHPTQEGLYGVTLRQKYSSDLYSDDGYLFLLWDFRDEATPLIHVRTWQPRMLDDRTPLPEEEIFNIRNFNLQ